MKNCLQRFGIVRDRLGIERHRQLGGDGLGARAIGVVEGKPVPAIAQLEHAERPVTAANRDGEPVATPSGLPLLCGGGPADQRALAERLAGGEHELVALGVEEEQRERLRGGDALDRIEHRADQLAQIEGRGHGAQAGVQLLELAEPIGETAVAGHGGYV